MAHVIDRHYTVNKDTGRKRRTERYGKGLRWQVEYLDALGKKRKKSFQYRDLADAFCADKNAEQHRGVYRRGTGKETFAEVAEQYCEAQLQWRESTRINTVSRLKVTAVKHLGHKRIDSITRQDVQNAVGQWALERSPSTIQVAYVNMRAVFEHAVHAQLIPQSPCVKIRLPRVEHEQVVPISDETLQRIADEMRPNLRAMVWLVAATGLRGGEVRGLTWDRVGDELRIDRQVLGAKAGKPVFGPLKTPYSRRRVPVGPGVIRALQAHRAEYGAGPGALVFQTTQGLPLRLNTISAAWRTMREAVPEAGDGWHQLRHHHASKLIAAGFSPVAVANRLGHKDASEVISTYAHMFPSEGERMALVGEATMKLDRPALRLVQ